MYGDCDANTLQKMWREISTENSCVFKITRGERAGQECGKKTKTGSEHCSRHERARESRPRKLPRSEGTSKRVKNDEKRVVHVLRKHPTLNVLYHSETDLVFKSARNRVVIGMIRDGEVCDLDDDVIEVAKKNGFTVEE